MTEAEQSQDEDKGAPEMVNPLELPNQDPWTTPLDELDVARPQYFERGEHWAYFERLRKEAPVHFCRDSAFGPYWSISSYEHIKHVDQSHKTFSSEPSILIQDPSEDFQLPMFIAMDQPKHDEQRKVVQPTVAPRNLVNFESLIRQRTAEVLDELPENETFDWVDTVSIELTTRMLATLFDFPFDERRKLTHWSDVATRPAFTEEARLANQAELRECLGYFIELWNQRQSSASFDLISMMASHPDTRDMSNRPMELLGNLILLIVGGNDTTRNSMSASVYALNQFPKQYEKLIGNPQLIGSMVPEVIRWQTPLGYMRRIANKDVELNGQQIREGDKVIMWYVSGNRDESMFPDAGSLDIERANARQHLSFGYGIHRCMGNRLGEMQLRILWEEILKRFENIEVVDEPELTQSVFVMGYTKLPVRVTRK